MKNRSKKFIAVATMLCLISGCATIQNDSTRTKTEGAGASAIGFGTLGAGIGYLVDGKRGALIGGGIGAVFGGTVGYAYAGTVAERKEKYANDEDRLKGEINVVTKANSDLEEFNQKTRTQIQDVERQIDNIKEEQRAGHIQTGMLEREQNKINEIFEESKNRRDYYSEELAALNDYHTAIAQSNNQAEIKKLETEISTLREQIAMLDESIAQMAQLVESVTINK